MNMNVWTENTFSDDDDSDYEIVESDNDSMPSLEDAEQEESIFRDRPSDSEMSISSLEDEENEENEANEEHEEDLGIAMQDLFEEEATIPSPNSVNSIDNFELPPGPWNGADIALTTNQPFVWPDLLIPTGYRNLGQGGNIILRRNTSNVVPRSQIREIQRNLLIDIEVQDCMDKMVETLEIDYQNPFAIKIQTVVRSFLARKKMNYLKKVQAANKTTHSCCVCYNDLHSLNMSITPCGHYYCSTCLFRWMNQNNSCAMCRQVLYKPTIDINHLDRSTRRAVRYHSRLQRRILDLENNKQKLQYEEAKIVESANQAMARQLRMRSLLAETRKYVIHEEERLDDLYAEFTDLIYDVNQKMETKMTLEKELNKKFTCDMKKYNSYKKNKRKQMDKMVERTKKVKLIKLENSFIPLTTRSLINNTHYESFANFWDNITELENSDIVDEVIV